VIEERPQRITPCAWQTASMNVTIRAIGAEEWPLWRDLRLRALADSPDAFRPTLAEESAQPDEWWAEIIGTTAAHPRGELWIAWVDGEAVGMLFGRVDREYMVLEIGAMWVAPAARRAGVGSGLIQACVEWGRVCGASTATLWATEVNREAVAFYERHGFRSTESTEALRPGSHLAVRRFQTTI
jgi:GNAT superfamily N-acetyltransferase